MRSLCLVGWWFLALVLHSQALNITVLPNESLDKCVTAAMQYTEPVYCFLSAGSYRDAVNLTPEHTAPLSIIGDGSSTLSGTQPVPDLWEHYKGHVWKTHLPPALQIVPQQLFVSGQWISEARFPNSQLAPNQPATGSNGPLSKASWARSANGTDLRSGIIVDDALVETNITGAIATLNVGFRFLTWTRRVLSHDAATHSFTYDPTDHQYGDYSVTHSTVCSATQLTAANSCQWPPDGLLPGHVGGSGNYLDKAADNLYFLTGTLGLLDSPGEWFVDTDTWTLYIWTPDSQTPAARVSIQTKDYCVQSTATAPLNLVNLSFHSCTFNVQNCNGCQLSGLDLVHPTFQREIPHRDVNPSEQAAATVFAGNDSVIERLSIRYANNGGIKIVGSRNILREILIEDIGWLGTLDFPPIELGFGDAAPTARGIRTGPEGQQPVGVAGGATFGNDNRVERVTVRRVGSMGILTSQRSNEISFAHVSQCGLIGLDSAGIHADNTFTSCMNYSVPHEQRTNCTKRWHHNWVHDCTEKCVRGDDRNLNLTVDHTVAWNCGWPHFDRNDDPSLYPKGKGAATGFIIKGDYNRYFANTIFNTSIYSQGDLCVVTSAAMKTLFNISQQNVHSQFYDSVNKRITGQSGPTPQAGMFAAFDHLLELNITEAKLQDPENFNFEPDVDSPLRGKARGGHDVGAYQFGEPRWVPGCTFNPRCRMSGLEPARF